MILLEWLDQLDQWRISKHGSELTVTRWIGNSPALRQALIFRRSSEMESVAFREVGGD